MYRAPTMRAAGGRPYEGERGLRQDACKARPLKRAATTARLRLGVLVVFDLMTK